MQFRMSALAFAAGVIVLTASAALAGQFAEFEEQLRATDAPYRSALFQTNKKGRAASEQALKKFSSDWADCASMSATFLAGPFRGWFRGDQSRRRHL
jgi:hypothetical protein